MLSSVLALLVRIILVLFIRPAESYLHSMGLFRSWSSRNLKKPPPPQANGIHVPNGAPTPAHPPEPKQPTEFEEIRNRIDEALTQMGALLKAMKAPLPTGTGNGAPLPQEKNRTITSTIRSVLSDLSKLGIDNIEKVAKMGLTLKAGEDVDDREYLMEYLIQVGSTSSVSHWQQTDIARLLHNCPAMW